MHAFLAVLLPIRDGMIVASAAIQVEYSWQAGDGIMAASYGRCYVAVSNLFSLFGWPSRFKSFLHHLDLRRCHHIVCLQNSHDMLCSTNI